MHITQLSIDTLARAQERFAETLAQMSVAQANTMPQPLIKSVSWLMWHTAREIDYQISHLNGSQPLWLAQGWKQKFALDLPDDTEDWRHTPQEAAKVQVGDVELLKGYLDAAVRLASDYLQGVSEAALQEVIDTSWNPPVTRQVRIVSIVDDAVMHSGQAVYTRRLVIGK